MTQLGGLPRMIASVPPVLLAAKIASRKEMNPSAPLLLFKLLIELVLPSTTSEVVSTTKAVAAAVAALSSPKVQLRVLACRVLARFGRVAVRTAAFREREDSAKSASE